MKKFLLALAMFAIPASAQTIGPAPGTPANITATSANIGGTTIDSTGVHQPVGSNAYLGSYSYVTTEIINGATFASYVNGTYLNNTGVYGWTAGSSAQTVTADTGISRGAADVFDFGNGTQGDTSGTIAAAAYKAGAVAGVSCTGAPTSSFASVNGIVTHC